MQLKILIVDDNESFRSAVKSHLQQHISADIYEASSAELGVERAAEIKPDIVLMDLNLPGENGFNASRQIKDADPSCNVIILTMFEIGSFKKLAAESRATEFVGKSEVYDRLVPVIRSCLSDNNGKSASKRKG